MSEKEIVIAELIEEVETINNIAVIRFILDVIKSFKKDRRWARHERT